MNTYNFGIKKVRATKFSDIMVYYCMQINLVLELSHAPCTLKKMLFFKYKAYLL